ncbi:MAG: PAAR domain-containing protein [Saprospiraceae bacterium]|nr:PAAR domain-containing protein [Saprospiraceae bacterium]
MPLPAATVGSLTATGDTVLPPGNFQVLIGGLPAACVGDMVAGPFFNSGPAFIISGNLTVLVGGRPLSKSNLYGSWIDGYFIRSSPRFFSNYYWSNECFGLNYQH